MIKAFDVVVVELFRFGRNTFCVFRGPAVGAFGRLDPQERTSSSIIRTVLRDTVLARHRLLQHLMQS